MQLQLRQVSTHVGVAFVRADHHGAFIGNRHVHACHRGIGAKELFTQVGTGGAG